MGSLSSELFKKRLDVAFGDKVCGHGGGWVVGVTPSHMSFPV